MFDIKNVKVLHLEPTSKCNAACPQCSRFDIDGIKLVKHLQLKDLTLEKIKSTLSTDFVVNLNKMFMCGMNGEPAASKYCLQIYDWFREINPSITLGMNTNGGLRSKNFWNELGKRLNNITDYCVFSIDGLKDTNHIYRRNVDFNKVIENARAFIKNGGRAHWDMLIFKHNEHQIEECKQLAKSLGFVAFRAKVSRRFLSKPIAGIEPPLSYDVKLIKSTKINCQALQDNSLYMDYLGNLKPCCFLSNHDYSYKDFPMLISNWGSTNSEPACISSCSEVNTQTNFNKQWVYEEYFL